MNMCICNSKEIHFVLICKHNCLRLNMIFIINMIQNFVNNDRFEYSVKPLLIKIKICLLGSRASTAIEYYMNASITLPICSV